MILNTVIIKISGKVYKTGYRHFVKQMAGVYKIHGNIQYQDKESVLIEATANHKDLQHFIDYCRLGNSDSQVKNIKLTEPLNVPSHHFEIKN